MTDTKQPEALALASSINCGNCSQLCTLAAKELLSQHARIAELEAENRALKEHSPSFQHRVQPWLLACFGPEIAADKAERNHRFLEDALELVQSCGCTASEAHQLVDYVFGRPVGEPAQEAGGVMVTLAALCLANDLEIHTAGETELTRIWTKVEAIRAKQAAKPKHSPLPEAFRSITWPKGREAGRMGDMTPLGESHLRVGFDSDNDVYVSVFNQAHGVGDIEFCTYGQGGGKSPRTREALIAVMAAMEEDSKESPSFSFPPGAASTQEASK